MRINDQATMPRLLALAFTAILIVGGLCAVTLSAGADENRPGPSVLIVGDAADEMPSLRGMLAANRFEVEQCAQEDMPLDLADRDAVVVYIHSIIRPEVEKALIDYVRNGGRMLVLHHAIASAKWNNPRWLDAMGISIAPRDDPKHPWKVSGNVDYTMVNLCPAHPITTDGVEYDRKIDYVSPDRETLCGRFEAFVIPKSEVFHCQRHTDNDAKTLLFGYRMTDPETGRVRMEDTAGWYKPLGRGRLFYLQPGHYDADFRDPNFTQVIRNCLTWEPAPDPIDLSNLPE